MTDDRESLCAARDYELDFGLKWAVWSKEAGVGAYTVESVHAALDALVADLAKALGPVGVTERKAVLLALLMWGLGILTGFGIWGLS